MQLHWQIRTASLQQGLEETVEALQAKLSRMGQEKADLESQLAGARAEQQELTQAFAEAQDRLMMASTRVQVSDLPEIAAPHMLPKTFSPDF